ncbi:MAG: hypothetical protein IMZ55_00990 [Acidobacteria bacterium]|nr:hypothetical protein [Acidobacteriota bacterium]
MARACRPATRQRNFGTLRPTGQEADRDVHLALHAGMPLVNPRGGYEFTPGAGDLGSGIGDEWK